MDNPTDIKEFWNNLSVRLEKEIGQAAVDLWIKTINPVLMEDGILRVEVPDSVSYNNIKSRYEGVILKTATEMAGFPVSIHYSLSITPPEESKETVTINKPLPVPSASAIQTQTLNANINPIYTFENFIVGQSNRFAHALSQSVANLPGETNPLFLYSQPGLGKTHLMHAIAHFIIRNNPKARILYTASENFVNEFIESIGTRNTDNFRNKYRNLDCLLLDDIQFLLDKEKSMEEFFYTFNSLFESKKQIVLTSDRPPRELAMDQRLKSRFLSGTVSDINSPDFETRMAILRQKRANNAKLSGSGISDEILSFIAEHVQKNIRELEGCLITVGNFCSAMNIKPTVETVKEIIKDHISDPEPEDRIDIAVVKAVVAEKFNIEIKDLNSKKKTETITGPRQIAMYLSCELTFLPLQEIGRNFDRDHSTVVYARNKIRKMILTDSFFNENINSIIAKIKAVGNSRTNR